MNLTQASERSKGRIRFVIMVLVVGGAAVAAHFSPLHDYVSDRELLLEFLGGLKSLSQLWWTPLALFGLYGLVSPLAMPISPLVMAGGVIFGTFYGGLINIMGCLFGLTLSYFLAKLLGRDFIASLGFKSLQRFETMLQAEQSFWLLVRLRFLPIPFPVFNFGAALAGVPFRHFFLASFVGMVPSCFAYTYLASALASSVEADNAWVIAKVAIALAILFVISFLPKLLSRGKDKVSSASTP